VDKITLTHDVPVPPAAAFYLFVGEISKWWPPLQTPDPARHAGVVIEARPGGTVSFRIGGEDRAWGEVVSVDLRSSIVFDCWRRGEHRHPSRVSVRFSDSEWGTRVTFEHDGWDDDNAGARARYGDWPLILAEFVAHTRRHARGIRVAARDPRGVA